MTTTFNCVLSVLMLLMMSWRGVRTNQCIFSTVNNLKAPNISVIETFIVTDFYNDCEFLCYENPSRCIAANVIPADDNRYLCQFISVKVTREYVSALEPNPNGKYIFRSAGMCQIRNL